MRLISATVSRRLVLTLLIAGTAISARADGPASPPDNASQCFSCHGADGNPSLSAVPIIAGQQPEYLKDTLNAYRSGLRGGGRAIVMQEIAKDLSDDDIAALSAWFGDRK